MIVNTSNTVTDYLNLRLVQSGADIVPVDDLPNVVHIVGTNILILYS